MTTRVIVQDVVTGRFLALDEHGDLSFARSVRRAYQFEDEESAALTAFQMCDEGFDLFVFTPKDAACPRMTS